MAQMSPPVAKRRLLTVREVAARLRVSGRTVQRLIERDDLPSLQLGGPGSAIRIDESEFDAWLYGERDRLAGTDDAA
jgi:excisionase family DNA binding protein